LSLWTEAAVSAALGLGTAAADVTFSAVATDTRALPADALFVALVGEHHDAHNYLLQAAAAGARGAVVSHIPPDAPAEIRYYVVPDTLRALGDLARFARRRSPARICAVAGSNGKTTTKELLRAVLGTRYTVHATRGNLNNLIGVPLTLLAMPADADAAVIELGTNVPGEVGRLGSIVEPDAVVVTNVSAEHLEGLGDLDGVLREETAVLPWLPANGIAVVPDEPAVLVERARALSPSTRVVGLSERADFDMRAENVTLDGAGGVHFRWRNRDVALALRGRHNARNALLAFALGDAWGADPDDMIAAAAAVQAPSMRSEVRRIGGLTVVVDCYNANPGSVRAAAELLADMPRGAGRVAIFGTMRELGPTSPLLHADVARDIAALDLDLIVATGDFVAAFTPLASALGDALIRESDPLAAFDRVAPRLAGAETVLLKGSRGVALERLLPRFEEKWGVLHPHGEAFGPRESSTGSGARKDAAPPEHTPTDDSRTGRS
jgi:UDP-N-acetylmuramoyl-tripeptide--D-alanyl-D-alanine ligase